MYNLTSIPLGINKVLGLIDSFVFVCIRHQIWHIWMLICMLPSNHNIVPMWLVRYSIWYDLFFNASFMKYFYVIDQVPNLVLIVLQRICSGHVLNDCSAALLLSYSKAMWCVGECWGGAKEFAAAGESWTVRWRNSCWSNGCNSRWRGLTWSKIWRE